MANDTPITLVGNLTTNCTAPGCDLEARTRGMCSMHYTRALRAGLPRVVRTTSTCTVPGCDRPHYGRGLCQTHWDHQRRGLELLPLPPLRNTRPARALVEDVAWLAGTDSPESIARRVGFASWDALRERLRRVDRADLIDAVLERRDLSPWAVAS